MNYVKTLLSSMQATFRHRARASLVVLAALGLAGPANAQTVVSHVTGWDSETEAGNQAESVCNMSRLADGSHVEVVAHNDDTASIAPTSCGDHPCIEFTTTDRLVSPGAAIAGYSYRVKSDANPNPPWTHSPLTPPTGWAALWGDPSVASNPDPQIQHVVFMTFLGVPEGKFDLAKGADGKLHGVLTSGISPIGGACIFRSTDGGQNFTFTDCVQDTTNAGYAGDNFGHFYDGSSTAIAESDEVPGDYSAYVAFNDTETRREALFRMADVTNNDPDPFAPDHTVIGPLGPQLPDCLGAIRNHVRLLAHGTDLWRMSAGTWSRDIDDCTLDPPPLPDDPCNGRPGLKLAIRNRNADARVLACNPAMGAWGDFGDDVVGQDTYARLIRTGPQFAFDIGLNEANQAEMRFVFISTEGGYHLLGGFCPVDGAVIDPNVLGNGCQIVPEWSTQPESAPMDFFPAIKYARDEVVNRSGWKVTFQRRTAPQSGRTLGELALFAADLERPDQVENTPTIDWLNHNLIITQVTEPQQPCPDRRQDLLGSSYQGYWGDYDGMTYDQLNGCFVRAFTDSSRGCNLRLIFTSSNVHVSTACIPLRPPRGTPAPVTPLTGYQFAGLQEQVKYVDINGHIYELYLTEETPTPEDPTWYRRDLTQDTGGPTVALDSGIEAFESTYNTQQHVVFRSSTGDRHIWELIYSNSSHTWAAPKDLIASARNNDPDTTPDPKDGSPLAAYETWWNQQLHVDYIAHTDDANDGVDGMPHELWYDTTDSDWHGVNLYDEAGVSESLRVKAVNLVGYVTSYVFPPWFGFQNQQHVIFIGEDDNLYEFYYDTEWHWRPLFPGGLVVPNSALSGYVTTYNPAHQQHVIFLAKDEDDKTFVIELMNAQEEDTWTPYWVDKWVDPNTPVSPSTPLAGYQTTYNGQQHVNFVDVQNRVWEAVRGTGYPGPDWYVSCLTAEATDIHTGGGTPFVATGGSHLAGYQTTWDSLQHVVFTTDQNEVYELFYQSGQWKGNNLTQFSVAAP